MRRQDKILIFALVAIIALAFYFRQADDASSIVSSQKLSSTNVGSSNVISPTKGSSLTTARSIGLQKISNSTYVERLARLREKCLRSQGHYNEGRISLKKWVGNNPTEYAPRIYVSDKYKIAVCNVPKCGSTQWRQLIARLESNYKELTPLELKPIWTERLLWRLHDISTPRGYEAAERKVNEYYRIMTVREPLERLVSAYKHKLAGKIGGNFGPISHEIHSKYGNGSAGTATFSELVDSILDESSPDDLDKHWKPFTYNCDPCLFNFDIIAKLESINQDFPYIAKKLHIRRNSSFSDNSDTLNVKWRTSYHDYYKSLSQRQRLQIFNYYKAQYDFFGYPYPDYI